MKNLVHLTALCLLAASGFAVACSSSEDASPSTESALPDASTPTDTGSTPNAPTNPTDAGNPTDAPSGPTVPPIAAPDSTWTWVDVPGAVCDDGTPTGIGIWPSPAASKKLMFFFAGGGACWDYDSCVANSKSVHGPFGKTEFDKNSPAFGGWIIGHGETNPFKDYTTVFVPYCTSDLHAGDAVTTYTDGTTTKDFHHKGRANVALYLERLKATFPTIDQLAVTGSSAGGGGALLSYPAVRDTWPTTQSFLVDDSLPFFQTATPLALRQAWYASWNLTPLLTPICGASCVNDMTQVFSGTATHYPNDRMALLSFTSDYVIGGYYGMNIFGYWEPLKNFTSATLNPIGHFKHFYQDQFGHTMLTDMDNHNQGGVNLTAWLSKMASGDATWDSVGPF